MRWFGWVLAFSVLGAGCTRYEYEEEVFLEVDGSGRIRISGSLEALRAIQGEEPSEALFEGEGMELSSIRETERDGRKFVHVQARFASWEDLCRVPAFRSRRCRLERRDNELSLELSVPPPPAQAPREVDSRGVLALRFHFPSTVRYHNSPAGIERGNILAWKRTFGDHFASKPLAIEARFDRSTILLASVRILLLATGLVVLGVVTALWVMVRKGRRQLRLDHPANG